MTPQEPTVKMPIDTATGCTPNRVILFVLFVIIGLVPFLGKTVLHPAQGIQNHSLRKIYTALAEPLAKAGMRFPTAAAIPALRESFLRYSGLAHEAAWDSFFYTATADTVPEYPDAEEPAWDQQQSLGMQYTSTDAAEQGGTGSLAVSEKQQKLPYYIEQKIIPFSAEHPLRLLFFGDSQMHFIASGMKRALGSDPRITIEEISIHSSGFLRSDYYNWPKKLTAVLTDPERKEPFHAAVMILGMNDYQDIADVKGTVLQAGTPEWEAVYRGKMHRHIATVLRTVPRLYWLGLPAVRSTDYDEKIQYLDSLQTETAAEYPNRVIKVSLQELVRSHGSGYITNIHADDGTAIPFMQSDGIHYTIPGSEYLMQRFLTVLSGDYLLADLPPQE